MTTFVLPCGYLLDDRFFNGIIFEHKGVACKRAKRPLQKKNFGLSTISGDDHPLPQLRGSRPISAGDVELVARSGNADSLCMWNNPSFRKCLRILAVFRSSHYPEKEKTPQAREGRSRNKKRQNTRWTLTWPVLSICT